MTLAHMSPQASTLPGMPLQDGQAVILVNAAAHSGETFNYFFIRTKCFYVLVQVYCTYALLLVLLLLLL